MPTPQSAKVRRREAALDRGDARVYKVLEDNARVDRTIVDIGNLKAFDRDQLSKLLARGEGRFELPFVSRPGLL
jgi:hypothetical protein